MRASTTRAMLVMLAAAILLSGCTWGRRPSSQSSTSLSSKSSSPVSPRMQPNPAALSADVQAMRMENEALRAKQHENEKKLGDMTTLVRQMQREQQAYREAMATNFDLLEQSVALTLANSVTVDMGPAPAASPAIQPAPAPAKASPINEQGSEGTGTPKANMANSPTGTVSTPALRIKAAPVAAVMTPLPSQAIRKGNQGQENQEDPDLTPPANPTTLSAHRPAKPLYEKGFALFARRQFDQSIIVFGEFLRRYPNDIYSDNAQFWIGESYLRMKKLDEAELAYRKVLRRYEHRSTLEGYKTPDAIYRIGQTYNMRKESPRARYYFQALTKRFPDSSAGRKAKQDLASIGLKTAAN